MSDITAKIAAKGCSNTGFTEDLIAKLHDAPLGRKVMAVVELSTEARTEKRDGKETVALSILTLEPALDSQTEDHLREIARALHSNRHIGAHDGQGTLPVSSEPSVAEVVKAGASLRPHPFIADDLALDNPICNVCGTIEASSVHSLQTAIEVNADDAEDELDEENEPHAFQVNDGTDSCRLCGRFADDGLGIHVTDEIPGVPADTDDEDLDAPDVTPEMSDLARQAREGLGVVGDVMAEHGPDAVKDGMQALDDIAAANPVVPTQPADGSSHLTVVADPFAVTGA